MKVDCTVTLQSTQRSTKTCTAAEAAGVQEYDPADLQSARGSFKQRPSSASMDMPVTASLLALRQEYLGRRAIVDDTSIWQIMMIMQMSYRK